MWRPSRSSNLAPRFARTQSLPRRRTARQRLAARKLAVEPLEDRRLLSVGLAGSAFFGGAGDQRGIGIGIAGEAIYLSGNVQPESQQPSDTALVLRYAAPIADNSPPAWSRSFGSGSAFFALAATGEGVYPVGYNYSLTSDPVGGKEVKSIAAKFAPDGSAGTGPEGSLWVRTPSFYGYSGVEMFTSATTAVVGGSTYLYAAGGGQPYSYFAYAVARFDTAGNLRVATDPFATSPPLGSDSSGIAVLGGNVYVAGSTGGSAEDSGGRPALWKYNANLDFVQRVKETSLVGRFNGVTGFAGAIYAAGHSFTPGVAGSENYLVQKYDEAGNRLWSTNVGGANSDVLTGVVGIGSRLFAVGYTGSQGAGGTDAVVLEINPATGAILSTTLFGGTQDDKANGVATNGTDLYVVGESRSFAVGGNAIGQNDGMLLRFTSVSSPTADAGGPYSVPEGGSVTLIGTGSDPDGAPLTYAWDLDNNGTFETPGQSVTFSAAGRDGPDSQTVMLRVSDNKGASATSTGTVNITNVQPAVTAGLVSWWAGDGNAKDSWDGNHGTLQNGAAFGSGRHGQAFHLDGVDDEVLIPYSFPSLDLAKYPNDIPFTLSAWVKRESTDRGGAILSKYNSSTSSSGLRNQQFIFDVLADGKVGLTLFDRTDDYRRGVATHALIMDTQWHHVAASYDPSLGVGGLKLYVDGHEAPACVVYNDGRYRAMHEIGEPLRIGSAIQSTGVPYAFPGLIDDALIYNRALSSTEIQSLAEQTGPHPSDTSGLVSRWRADGTAEDSHGCNHGSLQNGTTFTPGQTGQAFSFDGGNDFVSIRDNANLRPSTFTIAGWVNLAAVPGSQEFIPVSNYGGNSGGRFDGWIIRIGSDLRPALSVHRQPDIQSHATSSQEIALNTWVHLAGTYDGTTAHIYVDGTLRGSAMLNGGYTPSFATMTIGKASWFNGGFMSGLVDEVLFYDRALPANDVRALAGQANQPPTADGGGPYTVAEGGSVTLIGSGSDPDGDPLTYVWDLDNNGTFETPGQSVTFSAAGRDGPDSQTVMLRVSDNKGASATSTATANITNVAPTLSSVRLVDPVSGLSVSAVNEGSPVRLTGNITDPGTRDAFTLTIDWGDGTTESLQLAVGSRQFTASHTYVDDNPTGTSSDQYSIRVTVTDDDGAAARSETWASAADMNVARVAAATRLLDGRVLVVTEVNTGQPGTKTAELYDPASGTWTLTGSANLEHPDSRAVLLQDGRVLVAGGSSGPTRLKTAELYDPATGTWTVTASMNRSRHSQTMTRLANGKILAAGGYSNEAGFDNTAEIYDPATGVWTFVGSMAVGRWTHSATLLPDGRVLIAGGENYGFNGALAFAEIYNPTTGTWTSTSNMAEARAAHTATLLADGTVLVVGGGFANFQNVKTNTAEIYNLATGTWSSTGSLATGRASHTATLLSGISSALDGKVLVVAGVTGTVGHTSMTSAELYDPITRAWTSVDDLNQARDTHAAVLLADGSVLVLGGIDRATGQSLKSSEILFGPILSVEVTVQNVVPTVNAGGDATVDEGSLFSRTGSFGDPGSGPTETWTAEVDYGDGSGVQPLTLNPDMSFSLSNVYADNGTYTVTVAVTDDDGGTATATFTVAVNNIAPTVDPLLLSSTAIDENGHVMLSGTFTDPGTLDTHQVAIDWGDGSAATLIELLAGERTFAATRQYLDDDPRGTPWDIYTITATVTDDDTGVSSAAAELTVNNLAPQIADFTSSAIHCGSAAEGQAVHISGTFTDAGTLDTHSAIVDWGDGAVEPVTIMQAAGAGSLSGSHVYADGGIYTITVTLMDDDSGVDVATASAVVTGAGINQGVLYVIGTDADDRVTVNQQGNRLLKVHADFLAGGNFKTFSIAAVDRIVVVLCDGDDHATIAGNISIPTLIEGGDGDDHLKGGRGSNVLNGGRGNDMLIGGLGHSILIGGSGADRLVGNAGEDILIAGRTSYDADSDALDESFDDVWMEIAAVWNSAADFQARVASLRSGLLNGKVHDDDERDLLTGAAGLDWFFANLEEDLLTDLKLGESIN